MLPKLRKNIKIILALERYMDVILESKINMTTIFIDY
jgi:hypothetical protein